MFYGAGTATARGLELLYDLLELAPPELQRESGDVVAASRRLLVSP
jgi:hypothetical protein